MRDRSSRSVAGWQLSSLWVWLKLLPTWVVISLIANVILLGTLLASLLRSTPEPLPSNPPTYQTTAQTTAVAIPVHAPRLGERHQLSYEQWVEQLAQEAKIAADQQPDRLTVLAGDSISLWFPSDLLPDDRTWLNQGISGETSAGLLKRLDLFKETRPETIFLMIGINDLLRGESDQPLLEHQQQIVQALKVSHPHTQIVVQSILPHAAESDWEGRDRLLAISNQRIQDLNEQLETMARQEGVYFLDLYPLFANPDGDLRPELSTDGLHLSSAGYQTWAIALQVYSREVLGTD